MLQKSPDTRFLTWTVNNSKDHVEKLIKILPWQRFKNTNRMVCSLGRSYPYSGHVTQGHSFDLYPPLKNLMDKLNTELNTNFNSVLLNYQVFHLNLNNILLHFLKNKFLVYI